MLTGLAAIRPTTDEVTATRAGDDLVPDANVVMDRGFTVDGSPEVVWPWLLQLGKRRAGWYLPRSVERFVPSSRRAARIIDLRWQDLHVGDVVPDYGGAQATFDVAVLDAPSTIVYESSRGHIRLTWTITVTPQRDPDGIPRSRVHLRLRLGSVRHRWLAATGGRVFDALTIAGMAAGLSERLRDQAAGARS